MSRRCVTFCPNSAREIDPIQTSLLFLRRRSLRFCLLRGRLPSQAAISAREQPQSRRICRITFRQCLKIRQSAGKVGKLNLSFRQSQAGLHIIGVDQ